MTFKYFVEMLYPIIGRKEKYVSTKSDFILLLVSEIMENHFDMDNNPLSGYKENTLQKIFKGERPLNQDVAIEIISNLNRQRFEDYLSKFSNDTIDLIGEAMKDKGETILDNHVIDNCTECFVSILWDCAKGISSPNNKSYPQWLSGKSDKIEHEKVRRKICEIAERIDGDEQIADKIRSIFGPDIGDYRIEDFIEYHSNKSPFGDVIDLLQTVYENIIVSEEYDDVEPFYTYLNKYIDKSTSSLCSPEEINELRKEIINLLCEIYHQEYSFYI